MRKIDLLFPRPVYQNNELIDTEYLAQIETEIRTIISKDGIARTDANNVDSSFQTSDHLDKEPVFARFAEIVLNESKVFLKELGYDDFVIENCKLHKMWTNISYENDFIFPHNHGDCLVAGVFYVKAPAGSKIHFFDNFEKIKMRRSVYNQLSYEEYSYNCVPNTIMLFENNMIHGNKKQPRGEKIAISFNVGI